MTKAKQPTGAPAFFSAAHSLLSKVARAALIAALGFPADSQDPQLATCLRGVERWLGFYPGGVDAIDNAPVTAVYVSEVVAVRKAALKLVNLLNDLPGGINPWTRDTLIAHFDEAVSMTEPDGIDKALSSAGNLVAVCDSVLISLEAEKQHERASNKSTRGRKKSGARECVLTELLALYNRYSKRPYEKRVLQGAIAPLSDFEKHELAFIRAAFRDIKADNFGDANGNQKWLELIRQIRQASGKPRMRASKALEPRHRKKGTQTP